MSARAINSESFSGGVTYRDRSGNVTRTGCTTRDVSVDFNLSVESSSDEARSALKAPLKSSVPTMGSAIGD